MSLVALEFAETSARGAREAALAACGSTGFLVALTPQRFVIADVGPRGASPRADQAIAERIRTLAMAALSARSDPRRARLRCLAGRRDGQRDTREDEQRRVQFLHAAAAVVDIHQQGQRIRIRAGRDRYGDRPGHRARRR